MTYLYVTLTAACLLCWSTAQDTTRDTAQEPPAEPTGASATSQTPDTFSFAPAFRLEAFDDFAVGFELRGLTSEGATLTSRLTAGPNPEDQLLGAALSYEQPLAPLFTRDLTLRVAASSNFTQGHPLGLDAAGEERTYTERLTQLSVGLGQPFGVFDVGLEGRIIGSETFVEDDNDNAAEVTLLLDDFSALVEATFSYGGQVRPGFPSSGGAAELSLGYGLGEKRGLGANEQLSWGQAELGLRGYLGFDERSLLLRDAPRFVLASRFNAGINEGDAPVWRRLSPSLRGYDDFALVGERYFDLSADLRYYTGLSSSFGDGFGLFALTPYVFADAGDAGGGVSERRYRAPGLDDGVQVSFGAGAQIGLETPFVPLPLNVWYARGEQGGSVGFEVGFLY